MVVLYCKLVDTNALATASCHHLFTLQYCLTLLSLALPYMFTCLHLSCALSARPLPAHPHHRADYYLLSGASSAVAVGVALHLLPMPWSSQNLA